MKKNQNVAYFKISKKPTDIRIAAGKIIKNDIPQRKIFVSENLTNMASASGDDSMMTSTEQSLRELVEDLKRLEEQETGFDLKTYSDVHISPLAKKIAEVEGLALEDIPLTSGRIEKKDVLRALELREAGLLSEKQVAGNAIELETLLPLKAKLATPPMVQPEKQREEPAQPTVEVNGSSTQEPTQNSEEKSRTPRQVSEPQKKTDAQAPVVKENSKFDRSDSIAEETQPEPAHTAPTDKAKGDECLRNEQRYNEKNLEEKTMLEAQSPIIQLMTEVDMTEIKELRKRISKKIEVETGVKCTFTDFLLMSVAKALVENPQLNGYYDDFQEQIVLYEGVQLGLSALGDKGNTIFPTIKNAEELNFTQMIVARNDLLWRAKKGELTETEQDPSFAIVNLGMYGILEFSSRIQDGNAAVLSVGKVVDRIRMVGNEESPRAIMRLNLNLDTRVCDGIIGAQFLKTVVDTMENPAVLLF